MKQNRIILLSSTIAQIISLQNIYTKIANGIKSLSFHDTNLSYSHTIDIVHVIFSICYKPTYIIKMQKVITVKKNNFSIIQFSQDLKIKLIF